MVKAQAACEAGPFSLFLLFSAIAAIDIGFSAEMPRCRWFANPKNSIGTGPATIKMPFPRNGPMGRPSEGRRDNSLGRHSEKRSDKPIST